MCLFHLVVSLMIAELGLTSRIKGVQFDNSLVPTPKSVVLKLIFILLLLLYLMGMSVYEGTAYAIGEPPAVLA